VLVVSAAAIAQFTAQPAGAANLAVEFVNVDNAGIRGIGIARFPSVSETGTVIAFDSMATGLVSGDKNNRRDVFVRDRRAGTTIRASVSDTGAEANNESARPDIGRFGPAVTFQSHATNLVNGDTNGPGRRT
jgi:TolB protein